MNEYTSLEDIQAKCEATRQTANKKKAVCRLLWTQLTTKDEKKTFATPTQRLLDNANKAAMIFDGVMFGTKLYRIFRGQKNTKKKSTWSRLFDIF